MADTEINVVLNTKEAIQDAKQFAPKLEKALSINPSGNKYLEKQQEILKDNLADAKLFNKETGKLVKGFTTKGLEEYEDRFKSVVELAERLNQLEQDITTSQQEQNKIKETLPSLRGKIGGQKTDADKEAARAAYNAAKDQLAKQVQLEAELRAELDATNTAFAEQYKSVAYICRTVEKVTSATNENSASVEGILATYDALTSKEEQSVDNTKEEAGALADAAAAQQDTLAAAEQTAGAQQQVVEAEKQVADESKVVDESLNKVGESAENAGASLQGAGQALVDATSQAATSQDNPLNDLGQSADVAADQVNSLNDRLLLIYDILKTVKANEKGVFTFPMASAHLTRLMQRLVNLKQLKKEIEAEMKKGLPLSVDRQREYLVATHEIERTQAAIKAYKQELKSTKATHDAAAKAGVAFAKSTQTAVAALKKTMRSATSVVKNLAKTIKSGLSPVPKALGKVRSSFDGVARSMRSNMKHLITSLTKYVLGFRSLFFLVRRLRKYIGEGIQNMAQFNDGNNHVNEGITNLLSSLLFLKNAWATAFSPIIQFVTAWLSALIDKLAEVGNAFSRFLGSLLGVGTVFQAVKVDAADYAKSLDNVGGSAGGAADKTKKLTDRLAAFDDLNVLGKDNDPDSTGSGGGGGAGDLYTPDPNEMFKLVDVSNEVLTKIKDMWAKADFSELGRTFRDKLVDALNKAQESMTDFETTAYNIGKSIITFLNGVLGDGTLWAEVGETIAQVLNTLGQFVRGVLENNEIDFGGGFATLINSFLSNTDWGTVNDNIKLFTEIFRNNVTSFLSTLNWDDVKDSFTSLTTALGDALVGAVSDQEFMTQLGIAVGEIINIIVGLFSDPTDTEGITSGLTTFFTTAFDTIDWEQVKEVLKTAVHTLFGVFDESDNPVINSFSGIVHEILSLVMELRATFNEIKPELISFFAELKDVITTILPVITQIVSIIGPILSLLLPIVSSVLEPLAGLIGELANTILPLIIPVLEVISPIIQQLVEAIFPVLSAILQSLQPVVESFITNILPMISSLLDHLMPLIQSISDLLVGVLGESGDLGDTLVRLTGEIFEPLFKILEPIFDILTVIFDVVGDLLEPITALIAPLLDILLMCLEPLFDNFDLIGEIIEITIVPLFKLLAILIKVTVVPALNLIVSGLQLVQQAFGFVKTALDTFKTSWKNTWNSVRDFTHGLFNTIISGIEGLVNGMIGGINKAIKLINGLSFTVPDWIPEIGGKEFGFTLREMSPVSLPRLAQGAVIPPNKEFMAVLGDQSHGTNIEAPLDTIKQAVAEVLANNNNQEVIDLLQQLITVVENKNLTIGDKQIGLANARYNAQQMRIRGTSF